MIKRIAISIIILFVSLILTLQYPHIFIEKQIDYETFKLYSNDDIVLSEEVKNVLDSVSRNLKESQFYKKNQEFELYFVQGTLYEKLIGWFGRKNIASSKFNKHIYLGKPNFKNNILLKKDNEHEWLNLVQIISHEGVHSQMYRNYSNFGLITTPSWINEGYSEYISYKPIRDKINYSLFELYQKHENTEGDWTKTEYGAMTPKQYIRDRLLIEYLIEIKHMGVDAIIDDNSLEPQKILIEIKTYFKQRNKTGYNTVYN